MDPFETTASKNFLPLKGETTLTVSVDKKLFMMGDTIKVHIICNNYSSKKVRSIKFYLRMKELKQTISGGHPKTEKSCQKIHKTYFTADGVFPLQGGLKWRGDSLFKIPEFGLNPSFRDNLFERKYHLCVCCVFKHAKNLRAYIPITLKEK